MHFSDISYLKLIPEEVHYDELCVISPFEGGARAFGDVLIPASYAREPIAKVNAGNLIDCALCDSEEFISIS
jgi:hypothetical protein